MGDGRPFVEDVKEWAGEAGNNRYCERHKYHFATFCWFCFCDFHKKPVDFASYGGYDRSLLEQFLKEHPNGQVSADG